MKFDQYVLHEQRKEEHRQQDEEVRQCRESFFLAMLKIARLYESGEWRRGRYLDAANVLLDALRLAESRVTVSHGIRLAALELESIRQCDEPAFTKLKEIVEE